MKIISAAVALTLVVSGCANVGELRAGSPAAIRTSSKEHAQVAACIEHAWTEQRIGLEANGAKTTTDGASIVVVSPPGGYPSEVAEVTELGHDATQVRFFAQKTIDVGNRGGKRLAAIDSCM